MSIQGRFHTGAAEHLRRQRRGMSLERREILGMIALLGLAMGASHAIARPMLIGTLPKEQNIFLFCTVGDDLMAKDCGPPSGELVNKRTQAFIQVETDAPDYLVGATPGARVLVMIRRSMAAPLDEVNPGRPAAPSSVAASKTVTAPDWAVMPSASAISDYFPERAMRMAVSGDATAHRTVSASGDLLGCWISAANPPDYGFDWATLKLSTFLRLKPVAKDGSSTVGGNFRLHAVFDSKSGKIALSTGE